MRPLACGWSFFLQKKVLRGDVNVWDNKDMNTREKRKKLIEELFNDELYVPMRRRELAVFMQVSEENRGEFDSIIDEMISEKIIDCTKRGKLILHADENTAEGDVNLPSSNELKKSFTGGYGAVKAGVKGRKRRPMFTGTFMGSKSDFGFVRVEGLDDDFFVSREDSMNAFNGDIVTVEVIKEKTETQRAVAKVLSIDKRCDEEIVGTYEVSSKGFGFVICDNPRISDDIFISAENSKGAVTGHKVVVEILKYGDRNHKPEGKITEILGHINDPGVDILAIVRAMGIPDEFPVKVLNQAENVSKPVSEADMAGREDLRDLTMVTIDSEDAKDLDDAVSLEIDGDIYRLGVHIADVSNYVQENSALDHEAYERGTSTYLADRVIPMLPHTLSNGICSLNAGEDRLCLSCIMDIDKNGNVIDHKICEGVINVNRRMNYSDVNKIIELNDPDTIREYEDLAPMFYKMHELSLILRKKRHDHGSIDFDLPEAKAVLDEKGHTIDIKQHDHNEATKLIEEFMLIANETVASHFYWMDLPFLYRVHEEPDPDRIEKLRTFIRNFGYRLRPVKDEIHPKEIQELISSIEDSPEEMMILRLTLRSMKKAHYSENCAIHFGLACDCYCHFTSPIRRYPDLCIHRIIKDHLRGRLNDKKIEHYREMLPTVALDTSRTERRSEECEREVLKLKKAEYLMDRMYEVYEGVISGVTNWGIYVELENTCEGLVHVSSLTGDFYRFDEEKYELRGEGTGKTFRLGEKLKVMVNNVDLSTRTVDFIIADFDEAVHDFYRNGKRI